MPDTDSTSAAGPGTPPTKVSTGVDGLDAILHGGCRASARTCFK
jgi:hypothetical protein